MSAKHPIIAITGSSGAGTTSVTPMFENIFRREGVKAAIVEVDAFHRYDRSALKAAMSEAETSGDTSFSHFGDEANLSPEFEKLFADYAELGRGTARKYLHNDEEAVRFKQPLGTFTPWETTPRE